MPEFRQDAITGAWTIVAEGRGARPNEYAPPPSAATTDCPFCEGQEGRTPSELAAYRPAKGRPDGPGWSVRTIPNKFPTLAPDAPAVPDDAAPGETRRRGLGFHEVVIESPVHTGSLATLPAGQVRQVFRMLRERVREVGGRPGIRAVVAFENSGPESGGTLFHPHAQVVGLADLPPRLNEELAGLERYARHHPGVCAYESEIARERAAAARVVLDTPVALAYCPFASPHPYEVRILPVRHAPSLARAEDADLDALVDLVPRVLRALRAHLPGVSYNLVSRAVADAEPRAEAYHWHLEVLPRLVRPDGFEIGGGIPVNPVPPETAARELRSEGAEAPDASSPPT